MAEQIKIEMKNLGELGWGDITKYCTKVNAKIRKGFGALGADCNLSKLELEYKADSLESAVILHNSAKQIRVSKDGAYVFEGYTEGNANVTSTSDTSLAWVTLNAFPYAQQFENAIAPNDLVFENCKICDPTDKEHSLVHLFTVAMYDNLPEPYKTIMQDSAEDIATTVQNTKVLEIARIEKDESILDEFVRLLHEHGLVYYMTGLQMYIVEPYNNDPTRPVQSYAYNQFVANPRIKTAPYIVEERTEVTLGKLIEKQDGIVFQLREDGEQPTEDERIGINEYYPEDGDLEAVYKTQEEEDNENIELFYATNLSYEYEAHREGGDVVSLDVEKAELNASDAFFRFKNTCGTYAYIWQLTVTAGHMYLRDTGTVVKDSTLSNAREVNEVESVYMVDTEDAEKYIQTYRAEILAEKTTFTLTSGRITAPEPNTLIRVGDIPTIMLVRYTEEDIATGDVTIYAVAFDVVPIGTTSTIKRPSVTGGIAYLALNLSGTSYSFTSDGVLTPADQLITATLNRYGTTAPVDWYINGELQDSHELVINVPPSYMENRYFISVKAVCGNLYTELYIYRLTQGKDAPHVIYQYCYHDSDTIAPLGAGGLWYMLGMPLFYTGKVLGDLNSEFWSNYVPEKPADKPYLWVRWSNDGGVTWSEPVCISGPPATSFQIVASSAAYTMTSRSYVAKEQKITFTCDKQNVPSGAAVTWQITASDSHITPKNGEGDSFVVTIGVGTQVVNFTVSCTVENLGTKSVLIVGVLSGEPRPEMFGVVRYPAQLPTTLSDGSPLMLGDYLLYIDQNGNEIPKYWSGSTSTGWLDVTEQTANYDQIMNGVVNTALTQEGVIPSTSVLYAYIGSMAAKAAYVDQFFAKNLRVQNPDNPNIGLRVRIITADANGQPIFEIAYDKKIIFYIHPSSGRVFFGQPNTSVSPPVPASGFMYNPANDSIVSTNENVVVSGDGTISAKSAILVDSYISGTANINNGYFSGYFDCASLKAKPDDAELVMSITAQASRTYYQAYDLYNSLKAAGLNPSYIYPANVPNTSVRFVVFNKKLIGTGGNAETEWLSFYDETGAGIKLRDLGYGYVSAGDPSNSYYRYNPEYDLAYYRTTDWYAGTERGGTYVTRDMQISIYEGGNILVLNVPGSQGGGVPPSEYESYEQGRVYVDSSGFVRCKTGTT